MNECSLCLTGNMEHERTALCRQTHTNWKNCGEECCVTIPKTSTLVTLHKIYELLEIPPDRWRDVMLIRLEAGSWHVKLVRRDDNLPLIVRRGGTARAALETYDVRIDQSS